MKKNKERKKIARSFITFQSGDDNECVALAKMGLSTKAIQDRTVLSKCQITYRLSKAKKTEGNQFGYRIDYRNGTSQFAMQMINDLAGIMREEVRRKITPKLTHPTPETIKL
jgi:hypothetical protein